MKSRGFIEFKDYYIHTNKFILRTPFKPYTLLQNTLHSEVLFEEVLTDTTITNALFVASPSLYHEYMKVYGYSVKKGTRVKNSLLKYLERMSTRCTPFGLFACLSIENVGEQDAMFSRLDIDTRYNLSCSIDSEILYQLSSILQSIPDIMEKATIYVNNTLYKVGNSFHYASPIVVNNHIYYKLSSTACTKYLNVLIRNAKHGCSIALLVDSLVLMGIDRQNAREYVNSVISSHILCTNFDFQIIGDSYLHKILQKLREIKSYEVNELYNDLSQVEQYLLQISTTSDIPLITKRIEDKLKKHIAFIPNSNLLQVDTFRESGNSCISSQVIDELSAVLQFVIKISKPKGIYYLEEFKKNFVEKYDRRSMALTDVLDPEIGIGYPCRHGINEENVFINVALRSEQQANNIEINYLETIVLKKMFLNTVDGYCRQVILNDDDCSTQMDREDLLPPSIAPCFQIIRDDNKGVVINLLHITTDPVNFISRFASKNNSIKYFAKEIVSLDKCDNKSICADIVCIPDIRVANIMSRPNLREYEIVYYAQSNSKEDKQIPISDIEISIENNKIILFSKKNQKRILPRQTNAHNYNLHSIPAYRFLCDLQYQNVLMTGNIDISNILNIFGHSPRIVYRNTILSPESWVIAKNEVRNNLVENELELVKRFAEWRCSKHIPSVVLYVQGDNKLYVDFDNANSILAFNSVLRGEGMVWLQEFIFDISSPVARDGEGNMYIHECILPFFKNYEN